MFCFLLESGQKPMGISCLMGSDVKEIREIVLPLRLSACLPSISSSVCPTLGRNICVFSILCPCCNPMAKVFPWSARSEALALALQFPSAFLCFLSSVRIGTGLSQLPQPTSLQNHLQTLLPESSGSLLHRPSLRAAWFALARPAEEASDR